MEISEVRVTLVSNQDAGLKAFCSMTLDNAFVIRDIKNIEAPEPFVAMPSAKRSDHCSRCGVKNQLRPNYAVLAGQIARRPYSSGYAGRMKLHADIAHPINAQCAERFRKAIVQAFQEELNAQNSRLRAVDLVKTTSTRKTNIKAFQP
jgi:stage V sporulation protein G